VIIGMTVDDDPSRAMWLYDHGALSADNVPHALPSSVGFYDCARTQCPCASGNFASWMRLSPACPMRPDGHLTLLVGADAADLGRPADLASLATPRAPLRRGSRHGVYKLMINLLAPCRSPRRPRPSCRRAGGPRSEAGSRCSGERPFPPARRSCATCGDSWPCHGTNVNYACATPERQSTRCDSETGRLPVRKCCRRALSKVCARRGRDNEAASLTRWD
jgi:hypothetical protein